MEEKVLAIIQQIRESKGLTALDTLSADSNLRNDLGFTSFDLAELTVRIEDEFGIDIFENGLVNTVEEVLQKLKDA